MSIEGIFRIHAGIIGLQQFPVLLLLFIFLPPQFMPLLIAAVGKITGEKRHEEITCEMEKARRLVKQAHDIVTHAKPEMNEQYGREQHGH